MELSKIFNITADYKDRKSTPSWELHTLREVVFIDKPCDHLAGSLYCFKNDAFVIDNAMLEKSSTPYFYQDDIFLVGEIYFVDRDKKIVTLVNKNTVAYRYLIFASGARPGMMTREAEFSIGMQALVDALRVKPKIPSSFAPTQTSSQATPSATTQMMNKQERRGPSLTPIDQIVHPSIVLANKAAEGDSQAISKRLYEVQI